MMNSVMMTVLLWVLGIISLGLVLAVAYTGTIIVLPLLLGGAIYISYLIIAGKI